MTSLPGPATPRVEEILAETCRAMMLSFGITEDEATGRIAAALGSWDLESEETELVLGHEEANYWSNFVYYGPNVDWWRLPPDELHPRPWP